jgi:hypothetical protein
MSCKGFERAPPVIGGPKTHSGLILHLFDHYSDNFFWNKFRECAGRDFVFLPEDGRGCFIRCLSCQGCEPLNSVITEALRIVSRHVTPNSDSPSLPTGGSPAANRFHSVKRRPSVLRDVLASLNVVLFGRLK